MPHLHVFTSTDLPEGYAHQVRSFVRIHWDDAYAQDVQAPLVPTHRHPFHVVTVDGPALLSHARVVLMPFTHSGATYRLYGLGDVLTYPAFRGRGLGSQVTAAATALIRQDPEADLAILFCDPALEGFYARYGWEAAPDLVAEAGGRAAEHRLAGLPKRLWIAGRAQPLRADATGAWALPSHGW